ncbi:TlpA family protein disulfide reductase [Reichenbachiella carrageenanivorans]|uniref:TlpA family protein disulfide reductase n=1 Tax=Reichenbachiella carrageenanivorans TaxID=2979869 RepID=A0ABY6CUK6_9BACT|nr:TlpA disulfide reductase family protein [Reichenbachiella carrageenanivorans]UXX77612.1 TlpA family protein disulfide reductase [Reichenbachiella carrageenanivorans]
MKKLLKEWGIILGIIGALYFTGLHTEVAGFLQQIILTTGLLRPEHIEENEQADAAYHFQLLNEQNESLPFTQFKGKTIFLNFWATWCPPCLAEMPDIHDLYLKMQNENVAFVLISQDKNFDKAKNFMERKGYTFPIYQLVSPLPQVFASSSIPTTFVISPKGKIIAKRVGMVKYDTESFRELLLRGE